MAPWLARASWPASVVCRPAEHDELWPVPLERIQRGILLSVFHPVRQFPRGDKLTMRKRQLAPRDGAPDHARHSACTRVCALRGTLLTNFIVARHVPCGDIGSALCLSH